MALPVEEVLSLWRELERTQRELPGGTPERQAIDTEIAEMRSLYQRLTEASQTSAALLDTAHRRIVQARAGLTLVGGPDSVADAETPTAEVAAGKRTVVEH